MGRIDRQQPGMSLQPDSGTNRTDLALIGYGIDTVKAVKLRKDGYTATKLRQMKRPELIKLGLNNLVVDNVLGGGRPPPPAKNLIEVLYANAFTCCVCRKPERGVIVHHIKRWAETRDHRVTNLSVLCTLDHAKVHTKSELTRNIDPSMLQGLKEKWEARVAEMGTRTILDQSRKQYSAWVYFNHRRLFELAAQQGIVFKNIDGFDGARALDLCDKNGIVNARMVDTGWMYSDGYGLHLYAYVREVLHAVLEKLKVANISDDLERGVLSALLSPGDFILVQGLHNFARQNTKNQGPGQIMDGSRKANKVAVEFTFDRFEATSCSAHGRWVSGRVDVSSIVRVGTITQEGGVLRIQGTVLGIAMGFSALKTREYSTFPYRGGVYRADFDEDEEDPFAANDDDDNEELPFSGVD